MSPFYTPPGNKTKMASLYQVSTLSEFEAVPDYHSNLSSRRSTLVSTMLRDSVRFFIININYFSLKKLIQVEIERRDNPLMESLHARGMELANILSLMTQKPRNGDLRDGVKIPKISHGSIPPGLPRSLHLRCSLRKLVSIYPRFVPAWNLKKEQHQRMGWVGSIKVGNITHLGRRAIVNTEIINTDNF